jgi:CheY-like chemotaxis protein
MHDRDSIVWAATADLRPSQGKRVLIVEDEILIAMMAEEMLTSMGMLVVGPSRTVREALELARSADFDIALLDLNLCGERVDPITALLKRRGIPVVFATGYGASAVDQSHNGPVVEKPYTEDALRAALETALVANATRPAPNKP